MSDPNNPAPAARRQQPSPPTETEPEQQQSAASGPSAAGAFLAHIAVVIDRARLRNWLAGKGDYSPYPGMLHDPDTDTKLDWQDAVRKVLWQLPEGARVTIAVSFDLPEPNSIAADDYWTRLTPHNYGHARSQKQ